MSKLARHFPILFASLAAIVTWALMTGAIPASPSVLQFLGWRNLDLRYEYEKRLRLTRPENLPYAPTFEEFVENVRRERGGRY